MINEIFLPCDNQSLNYKLLLDEKEENPPQNKTNMTALILNVKNNFLSKNLKFGSNNEQEHI